MVRYSLLGADRRRLGVMSEEDPSGQHSREETVNCFTQLHHQVLGQGPGMAWSSGGSMFLSDHCPSSKASLKSD